MKMCVINTCLMDDHYEDFVTLNQTKTRTQLDHGGFGNNKAFWVKITGFAIDPKDNDLVGNFGFFEDNKHISAAVFDGLDLCKFVPKNWSKVEKVMTKEVLKKEYDNAIDSFTKSGTHEKDLIGDGSRLTAVAKNFVEPKS
jgi:hypothetical protein